MKFILNKVIVLTIFYSFVTFSQSPDEGVSKRGSAAATFLSIGQGAKAIGMGSAFVGIQGDPSSMYWNPAGIATIPGMSILFDHTNWFADIGYNFFAGTYSIDGFGTLGLSIIISDIGEMDVTTIDKPDGTGQTFSATDFAVTLAYAIRLTDNFAIGFNPKFIYQSIWNTEASAIAFDMGVQYRTPFDDMILAMSISNFGTKMQLEGNSTLILYDEDPSSGGNNNRVPAYLETSEWALPIIFRVGLAYEPIKSEQHSLTFALDALHPSDNYESMNIGAEYTFMNVFSIRGGYKSLFLEESEESFALGFGLQKQIIGNVTLYFDYAYQDFGRLSDIQKFTFAMSF